MPTARTRIQVTIDDELAKALAALDFRSTSRSRLLRDLAVRGARAIQEDRDRAAEARSVLLEIANGERDHDFEAVAEVVARRGERLL